MIGKFCSNLTEQKTISTIQERCITFNNDGSFVEEIRLDVGIILTGKYLFSDNLIALTYDDEKNETSILKIIMKKYLQISCSIILMMITISLNAQNIYIPDANFKNALIARGVDLNSDGEIHRFIQ